MSYSSTRQSVISRMGLPPGIRRMGLPPGIKQGIPQFVPTSLGYTMTIGTPIGDQKINIPVEKLAEDVANIAINKAWPIAMNKLYAELPSLMNIAFDEMQPYMRSEIDRTMNVAESKIDDKMEEAVKVGAIGLGVAIVAGTGIVLFSKLKKNR